MTIYLSEKAAARAGLVKKAKKVKAKDARPDIPRAGRAEATGLTTLLTAGWSIEFRAGAGYRLSRGEMATPWEASEEDVCQKAKELGR